MPDAGYAVYQRISDHAMESSQDGFTMQDPNSVRDSTMAAVKEMPTDSSKNFIIEWRLKKFAFEFPWTLAGKKFLIMF